MSAFTKIGSGILVSSGQTVTLPGRAGGRNAKGVQIMVVVTSSSDTAATTLKIGVSIEHGPDGEHYVEHTGNSTLIDVDEVPQVAKLDTNPNNGMVGEWVRTVFTATTQSGKWARLDVYEMRKPF